MKKLLLGLFLFGAAVNAHAAYILPEDFEVYTNGCTVLTWQPSEDFLKVSLPTYNFYRGEDGGYIAVYTHDVDDAVYCVGEGIYVMGQIRVQGNYVEGIFIPTGYSYGDNITQDPELLDICAAYFPEKVGHMWVGGDTGGWFGL